MLDHLMIHKVIQVLTEVFTKLNFIVPHHILLSMGNKFYSHQSIHYITVFDQQIKIIILFRPYLPVIIRKPV